MSDKQPPQRPRPRAPARPPEPSPRALELLAHTSTAVTELRGAHAGVLAAVHALETENVAGETGYASTNRLLHDHVRLDRGETTTLRRHPTPERRSADLGRPLTDPDYRSCNPDTYGHSGGTRSRG